MRKGIWKEGTIATTCLFIVETYNVAYIERMEYLMKEEIKPSRSEIITMYHNLMCALVEVISNLKIGIREQQRIAVNTETKYHYEIVLSESL
jgi:hypothetical protein